MVDPNLKWKHTDGIEVSMNCKLRSEIIRNLPDTNVLFISNHQTYFADVVAMFHVLTSLKGERQYKKMYCIYGIQIILCCCQRNNASWLLTRIMAYGGAISRTNLA
jgi:1-acyl-sn-glycerol-3-phosphate acyltransferase